MKTILLNLLTILSFIAKAGHRPLSPEFELQKTRPYLTFIENKGQVHDQFGKARTDVLFSGKASALVYHLRTNGISYQLNRIDTWKDEEIKRGKKIQVEDNVTVYRVDLNWMNCRTDFEILKDDALPGYTNYYYGKEVMLRVNTYVGVTYKNIYNNIDLHYYEKDGALKYDYTISPGADYQQIKLEFRGAEKITLNDQGELIISTPLGTITEHAPLVFQNGKTLPSNWIIKNNIVTFFIQDIDPTKAYVIDPAIRTWGTYYGGESGDRVYDCTTSHTGDVFITGTTNSQMGTSIATSGSYQSVMNAFQGAFLVKFNDAGVRQWGTYYAAPLNPGHDLVSGVACAADRNGNIYFLGGTNAPASTGIVTPGSHQTVLVGNGDALLVKFDAAGVRLWATYYGDAGQDGASELAVAANGDVYMCGSTTSSTNIATPGGHLPTLNITMSNPQTVIAYLVKFNSYGVRQWGTYYGTGASSGDACAVDDSGNVFLAGNADGTSGSISTPGCHQPAYGGGSPTTDNYLVKFNAAGVRQWGTFYGGDYIDLCYDCGTDAAGNIYMIGATTSTNGTSIASPGSHQPSFAGGVYDGFMAKFNSAGVRQWGTYFGGPDSDPVGGGAVDAAGNVYIAGHTKSSIGISTPGSHQPQYIPSPTGGYGVYFAQFNTNGIQQWGTYYGPVTENIGMGCAANNSGRAYLYGFAYKEGALAGTSTLIATPGSHQPVHAGPGGLYDSFLAQFSCLNNVALVASDTLLCSGRSVTLTASGGTVYSWTPSGANSSIVITPSSNISYTVSGYAIPGCSSQAALSMSIIPSPTVSAVSQSSIVCRGNTTTLMASGATSYSWSTGSTVGTITVAPSVNTIYTVTGTEPSGCSDTKIISLKVSSCAGIDEKNEDDFLYKFYPNPAQGIFHVDLTSSATIIVYNTLGELVMLKQLKLGDNIINLEGKANGLYTVILRNESNTATFKLIKD